MNSGFVLWLLKSIENLFLKKDYGNEPRADVYISSFLLALGLFLIICGIGIAVVLFFYFNIWIIVGGVCCVLLGVLAIMCWKNQTVRVLSEEKFEYTTFLGNTYEYRFKEITAIRQNSDSTTVFVGKKKVHIESMAIVSDRFAQRLQKVMIENNL